MEYLTILKQSMTYIQSFCGDSFIFHSIEIVISHFSNMAKFNTDAHWKGMLFAHLNHLCAQRSEK